MTIKTYLKKLTDKNFWRRSKTAVLVIAVLVVAGVGYEYFEYTHSISYRLHKTYEECAEQENKTWEQCQQQDTEQYVQICRSLEPDKTETQCRAIVQDFYQHR